MEDRRAELSFTSMCTNDQTFNKEETKAKTAPNATNYFGQKESAAHFRFGLGR